MARSELQRLFENGLISECEYRRARGSKKMLDEYAGDYGLTTGPNGPKEYGANELRDRKTQRNDAPGTGRTVEFGPSDASFGRNQIDNKENRRMWPKGTTPKSPGVVGAGLSRNTTYKPTNAQVRAGSAVEFYPNWYYGDPSRRQ
jgi:hypothetical protein